MPSQKIEKITTGVGLTVPLGATIQGNGINFALYSQHATEVILGLFAPGVEKPFLEITLDPNINRKGPIWHIWAGPLPEHTEYAYHIKGPSPKDQRGHFHPKKWVIDPYATALNTTNKFGDRHTWKSLHGIIPSQPEEFPWEGDLPLLIPREELIIYEMHARGFTQDRSSKIKSPGTFLGIIEKIPYLKSLGVNAVELLPTFEFNETWNKHINPKTKERLYNYWGYASCNFFTFMKRYAKGTSPYDVLFEFKTMVKELHKAGIEVILDVVYNHTGDEDLSFRNIDEETYFILDDQGNDKDYTGCFNTFKCNHPIVKTLILDSLRYLACETHVDGFRFDLASIFSRGEDGEVIQNPPLIADINADPILSNVKLIAEAWDASGLYQVGTFPGGARWSEWNDRFRDNVRRFIKGTPNHAGVFATAICGSEDLYGHRKDPSCSINFITAHDGYTLRDLVTYQKKHNEENGEGNEDGNNVNESWNCGIEGSTKDPKILALRNRQMRNFIVALTISVGIPMLTMGDEYGHTRNGNNNPYCQDDEKNYFIWNQIENNFLHRFLKKMILLRKKISILRRTTFLTEKEIQWHGHVPLQPNWKADSRFVAFTLIDNESTYYIAFNAHFENAKIELPSPPSGKNWRIIVDTFAEPPQDYPENPLPIDNQSHILSSYSAIILQAL